jgi:hypothetical protein
MINWIKRIFCKHDYELLREEQLNPDKKDLTKDRGFMRYFQCKKCSKSIKHKATLLGLYGALVQLYVDVNYGGKND